MKTTLAQLVARLRAAFGGGAGADSEVWVPAARRRIDRARVEANSEAWRRRGARVGTGTRIVRDLDWINPHLIEIGDYCVIGGHILTHGPTKQGRRVKLGSYVYMGWDAIVLAGVTVGDGVIIGAGTVVAKDVPAGSIVAGNPGRVIRAVTAEERRAFEQAMHEDRYVGAVEP